MDTERCSGSDGTDCGVQQGKYVTICHGTECGVQHGIYVTICDVTECGVQ